MKKIIAFITLVLALTASAQFTFHAHTNAPSITIQPITLTAAQVDALIPLLSQAGIESDVPISSANLAALTLRRQVQMNGTNGMTTNFVVSVQTR